MKKVSYLTLSPIYKTGLLFEKVLRAPLLVLPVAFVFEDLDLVCGAQVVAARARRGTRVRMWHLSRAQRPSSHYPIPRPNPLSVIHDNFTTPPFYSVAKQTQFLVLRAGLQPTFASDLV